MSRIRAGLGSASLGSLLLAVVGCGAKTPMGAEPVEPGGPGAVRLRPWQLAPEGAAPVLLGITDTVEGRRCTFMGDSEGQLRCLPPSAPSLWSTNEFADASCKTPLYRLSLSDAAAFAGRPLTLPALPRAHCGPERHVVGIARAVPDEAPRYESLGDVCSETPPSRSPGEIGIVVDDVVAPTRYVAGTLVDGALVGGRVRQREIVTADGARFADHLVDERWGKRCTLRTDGGDAITCGVEELRESSYFGDAGCEDDSLALARAEPCADPSYLRAGSETFALGREWRGEVYERIKSCRLTRDATPVSSETEPVYYQRGEPLDGAVVARAAWNAEGAARLSTRGLRGDDGRLVALGDAIRGEGEPAFHDNVTGDDCRAIATPAGDVRCVASRVHTGYTVGHLFADASCTKPAYFCTPGDCDGFEFFPIDLTMFQQASATSPAARIAVAVAVPSGSVYSDQEGPCVATSAGTLFMGGADVPWDKYPLVPVTGAPAR